MKTVTETTQSTLQSLYSILQPLAVVAERGASHFLSQGRKDMFTEIAIANATPVPEHAECLENDTVTVSTSATEPAVMAPDHVNT